MQSMIILNGISYRSKNLRDNFLINNGFEKYFEVELIDYMKKTSEGSYIKGLKNLYQKSIFDMESFTNKMSREGYLQIWKTIRFGWPIHLSNYFQGVFRGKKRPEHSKKMKIKMLGIDRGDSFREIKRVQNGSINFKKKRLENKGICIDNLSDDEILVAYKNFMSMQNKSKEHRINKIKTFLKSTKYNEPIFFEFCKRCENLIIEDHFESLHKDMLSIISTITIKNNPNMGNTKFFKRGFKEVNYCLNKTIIKYRSSWELISINFFEEHKISYKYEPFIIDKIDNSGYYIPDFIFNYNGIEILLEIKGFIRGEAGKEKESVKMKSAEKYCLENNMKYVYLKKPLTNIQQIENGIKNN